MMAAPDVMVASFPNHLFSVSRKTAPACLCQTVQAGEVVAGGHARACLLEDVSAGQRGRACHLINLPCAIQQFNHNCTRDSVNSLLGHHLPRPSTKALLGEKQVLVTAGD